MAKLYFKYGAMGSSKSASALICKFNYEQKGMSVLLLKPALDTRDMINEEIVVKSRIGLFSKCYIFSREDSLLDVFAKKSKEMPYNVIIIDESQFMTEKQVEECKKIAKKIPVLCYGLLTNFKTKLFEGSKRLIEIADSLMEIKSVCSCGRKANVNARMLDGQLCIDGDEIVLGQEEGKISYVSLCYDCFMDKKKEVLNKTKIGTKK